MTTAHLTYHDLAARLDLPPTDDPAEQIRHLRERRLSEMDALAASLGWPVSEAILRLRVSRRNELYLLEEFLGGLGVPVEREEAGE